MTWQGAVAAAAAPLLRLGGAARAAALRVGLPSIALALLLPSGQAVAQTVESSRLLARPMSIVMCRPLPVTPADSAAFVFQFRDTIAASVAPWIRETTAAYDSAGRSLYMSIAIQPASGTRGRVTLFMVRLAPFAAGVRVEPGRGALVTPDYGARSEDSLTDAEMQYARRLAAALWAAGCIVPHALPPRDSG